MSDQRVTLVAAASVSAYSVVAPNTSLIQGQIACQAWATVTMSILGVAMDNASTNGAVPVESRDGQIVKAICNASVSCGAIVGPTNTLTGAIIERPNLAAAATVSTIFPNLGVALQSGSTNSVIWVMLRISNQRTV